jgi:hypothetical protein
MYADAMTDSMRAAIEETDRRRAIQEAYNKEKGIEPTTIVKGIRDLNDQLRSVAEATTMYTSERDARLAELDKGKVEELVKRMEAEMKAAAKELEFERAAALRDEIQQIRLRVLDQDQSAIVARAAELAARKPASSGAAGRESARIRPASALEVASIEVLPASEEPADATGEPGGEPVEVGIAEGTAADWLPGIRDEHEDEGGWQARWLERPTWDRSVTPNIRRRTGTRPPRRRRS